MSEKGLLRDALALAKARASVYDLLALGFSSPTEEGLEALRSRLLEVLEEEGTLFNWPGFGKELRRLQASTRQGKFLTRLRPEHTRLFVGPYSLPSPPYESVHREPEPVVMGDSTLDVLKRYEEAGFRLASSFKDLPDHVAVELQFMALLCIEEAQAWEREDPPSALTFLHQEEGFLREHLTRWVPSFCERVLSSTECSFYQAMASLTRDYILLDQDHVASLVRLLEVEGYKSGEGQRD